MEQFLGKTLFQSIAQGGQKLATSIALSPTTQAVGILFISSHCQPSLKFTQKLIEAYEEVNSQGAKIFEVVIASGDTEEEAYSSTFQAMPWLSLGFRSKQIGVLMRQFGVKKSPFLAVIDKDGTLITKEGKQEFVERGVDALKEWTAGEEEDVQVEEEEDQEYEEEGFEQNEDQTQERFGLNNQQTEYTQQLSSGDKYDQEARISINSQEPKMNFYQQPSGFSSQGRGKGSVARKIKRNQIQRAGSQRQARPLGHPALGAAQFHNPQVVNINHNAFFGSLDNNHVHPHTQNQYHTPYGQRSQRPLNWIKVESSVNHSANNPHPISVIPSNKIQARYAENQKAPNTLSPKVKRQRPSTAKPVFQRNQTSKMGRSGGSIDKQQQSPSHHQSYQNLTDIAAVAQHSAIGFVPKKTEFDDKKYMRKITPGVFMQHQDQEELYKRAVVTKAELNNAKDESKMLKTRLASQAVQMKQQEKLIEELYQQMQQMQMGQVQVSLGSHKGKPEGLMILKVKKKNQELRSNIAQLEQQLQEQKYMFKNTQIKELKMEIALLKDEALRLKRITKDTIKQAGTLEWEKMEIYTQQCTQQVEEMKSKMQSYETEQEQIMSERQEEKDKWEQEKQELIGVWEEEKEANQQLNQVNIELDGKVEDLEQVLEQKVEEIKQLEKQNADNQQHFNTVNKENESKIDKLTQKSNQQKKDLQTKQSEIENLTSEKQSLQTQLTQQRDLSQQLQKDLDQADEEIKQTRMELVTLKRDSKIEIDEKESQMQSLEFQLRSAKSQIEEKEMLQNDLEEGKKQLESALDIERKEKMDLEKELEEKQEELEGLQEGNQQVSSQVNDLKKKIGNLEEDLKKGKEEHEKEKKEILEEKQEQIDGLQEQIRMLQEQLKEGGGRGMPIDSSQHIQSKKSLKSSERQMAPSSIHSAKKQAPEESPFRQNTVKTSEKSVKQAQQRQSTMKSQKSRKEEEEDQVMKEEKVVGDQSMPSSFNQPSSAFPSLPGQQEKKSAFPSLPGMDNKKEQESAFPSSFQQPKEQEVTFEEKKYDVFPSLPGMQSNQQDNAFPASMQNPSSLPNLRGSSGNDPESFLAMKGLQNNMQGNQEPKEEFPSLKGQEQPLREETQKEMSFNKAASIKEQKGNFDEVPDDSPDEEEGEEENKKESHRQQLAKVPMIPDEDPIVCEILSLMFRQRYVLKKDQVPYAEWFLQDIQKSGDMIALRSFQSHVQKQLSQVSEQQALIFARFLFEYGKEDDDEKVEMDLEMEESEEVVVDLIQDFIGDGTAYTKESEDKNITLLAVVFNDNFNYDRKRIENKGKLFTYKEWMNFARQMGKVSNETVEISFNFLLQHNEIKDMRKIQFDKVGSIKQKGMGIWEQIESLEPDQMNHFQKSVFEAYQDLQKKEGVQEEKKEERKGDQYGDDYPSPIYQKAPTQKSGKNNDYGSISPKEPTIEKVDFEEVKSQPRIGTNQSQEQIPSLKSGATPQRRPSQLQLAYNKSVSNESKQSKQLVTGFGLFKFNLKFQEVPHAKQQYAIQKVSQEIEEMCEKMEEQGITLRNLLKDVIYTIKDQDGREYQAVLVDDLFTKLESELNDRSISGSQELQDLLEDDQGYIPLDQLAKLCEIHQILENTFSKDEMIDYIDFNVRSRRVLNRLSLMVRVMNMEREMTIRQCFEHLIEKQRLEVQNGEEVEMEVIKASNLFEWLKQVKVILKQPINDIIKVLKVDEKYPDYVSFNLLVSALDDLPANTYMETHLFCKVTDNKQFRTERNFFRQDLKAQARVQQIQEAAGAFFDNKTRTGEPFGGEFQGETEQQRKQRELLEAQQKFLQEKNIPDDSDNYEF